MPFIILGIAALLLSAITVLISYITYSIIFKRGRCVSDPYEALSGDSSQGFKLDMAEKVTRLLNTEFEDVEILSHDGHRLHGVLYISDRCAPTQILMHGYRSLAARDFSGGACEAIDRGHNILLIDQRAHGKSEGRTISFGALEARDCLGWIDFIRTRLGEDAKIILVGISMGAATVLLASAMELPENVKGVIADCPYSSAKEIIMRVGYEKGYPMRLLYPFVRLGARLFGKFRLSLAEPISVIDRAKVPILLIHGECDGFVPCRMSLALKEKNPSVALYTFPDADHGTSYCLDPEGYRALTSEFFNKILC